MTRGRFRFVLEGRPRMMLSRSWLIISCLVGLFVEIWSTAMRSRTCW